MLSFNSPRKQTTEGRSFLLHLVLTTDKSELALNLLRLEPNTYIQPANIPKGLRTENIRSILKL